MINQVFDFLKSRLQATLKSGTDTTETVVYPKFDGDPPTFTLNALNLFLINIEEESILRRADAFVQYDENGKPRKTKPPLRLILHIMMAAKYSDYSEAMKILSKALSFFQANPVFTPGSHPDLPDGVDKLILELSPMTYSQVNEVWSSLKTAALPGVCYKAKMVVIEEKAVLTDTEISEMHPSLLGS